MSRFTGLLVLVSLVGCGSQQSFESASNVQAPRQISASFLVQNQAVATEPSSASPLSLDKAKIYIAKSSLEKEFLLQAALIFQPDVAMGQGLKSRVVAFRQRGNKLYLLESTQGHTISNDLPQNLVLAEFNIIEETEEKIAFDFNQGMTDIYLYGDWHAQDFEGPWYDSFMNFVSRTARYSFIESAELNDKNQLVIRQIAQMTVPFMGMANFNFPTEVKYYLSPYAANQEFAPSKWANYDRMGFFEVAPQHTINGADVTYVSKWDTRKPIVYAISSNTPADYKQAVKDGVLYWNKVFGSELVQVVDGAPGVSAPDLNQNIVQWVNWDDAGFAYADAQMDPRTGEILHAQVYLTSAFAFHGKDKVRSLLRLINTPGVKHDHMVEDVKDTETFNGLKVSSRKQVRDLLTGTNKKEYSLMDVNLMKGLATKGLALGSMTQNKLCDFHFTSHMVAGLNALLDNSVTEAQILKVSQDYVREVVAHEIGHTLGLRHNFAGNLGANYPLSQRDQLIKTYLTTGSAPAGVVTSSSVMEYQAFEEGAITGDIIAKQNVAFSYDQKALETLYKGKKFAYTELPNFCTDSHYGYYMDCFVWDYGASQVEFATSFVENSLKRLPAQILERFIAAKTPTGGSDATEIEMVTLPQVEKISVAILIERFKAYLQFTPYGASLKVQRGFPNTGSLYKDKISKAQLKYLDDELTRVGGAERLFSDIPADYGQKAFQQFVVLLAQNNEGKGKGAQNFVFTDEEVQVMMQMAEEFFKQVQKTMILLDTQILAGYYADPILESAASEKLGEVLKARMKSILFAVEAGDMIMADIEVPSKDNPTLKQLVGAKLPKFVYDLPVRQIAASSLRAGRSPSFEKFTADKTAIKKEFTTFLNASLGTSVETIDVSKVSKEVAKWVIESRSVLGSIY